MEEQISQLAEKGVELQYNMIYMAVFISFAVQFAKVLLQRFSFFNEQGVKEAFYPLLSIGLTSAVYYFCGVQDWALAGVIMGSSAAGGYVAFSGTAKMANKINTPVQ
jgi:hypothetical protein